MFPVRGWLFASRSMDIARRQIDLAPQYGINHIQLSHSLVAYAEQILESDELRNDVAELIEQAHGHDIEVVVWTHEMQNVPAQYMVGGKVNLASRSTWDYVADKYEKLFDALPGLDGVVLTLTETRIRIDDDNEVVAETPPVRRMNRMINMIRRVCRERDARLIVRTFAWVPRTMLWFAEAMRDVPDDVTVMSKESWGDWYQYSPPNQFLGLFGRHPQIMEVDCWGEYAGRTVIPWIAVEHIRSRLAHARALGLAGAVARVDRAEVSTFGTPNEFNTFAYSKLVGDPGAGLDGVWSEWLERTYPPDAIEPVRRALARTNEIAQSIYFNRGIKGVIGPGPDIVEAEGTNTIRFWRDFHGQWEPEMAMRAAQLLNPTEETVVSLVSEKDRAISLCDAALADLAEAQAHMSAPDYEALRSGFERARMLATAWRAMTECVYLHKLMEQSPSPARREWFLAAGESLDRAADEIEQTYGKGFSLARPEALRRLKRAVQNIHSEKVLWSVPLGLYIAASPAVGDLTGDGLPDVVAVSSHKEIVALAGDGRRLWTFTTRGERVEYPHFSSPLIVHSATTDERRVLVGAADGRLYSLAGDGTLRWEYATGNRIDAAPARTDINNDGRHELIVGSRDGKLYCLTASRELWSVDFGEPIFAAPAVTPTNEIIVATLQGTVACVTAEGTVRWRHTIEAPMVPPRPYRGVPDGRDYALSEGGAAAVYASPLVADLSGDGLIDVVIACSVGRLLVYGLQGRLQWEAACAGKIRSSPCVVHRGTAGARIVMGSDDWCVHAIDMTGRTVWQFETGGPVRSSPVVVPERVAGTECIIVGSDDGGVYVLDTDGQEVEEYRTGGPIFGSPCVADVNGDGLAEIIVGSYDHRVYAFRTEWQIPHGQVVVGMFRGGPERRGV